jgi:hypothetical protein
LRGIKIRFDLRKTGCLIRLDTPKRERTNIALQSGQRNVIILMMVTLNIFFLDAHFFGFSGSSGPSQLTRTISAPSTSSFLRPSLRVGMAPFPITGGFGSGPGVPRVELVGSSSVPFSNLSKLSESSIFSSFPISGSVDGEKMWSLTSIHKGECGPMSLPVGATRILGTGTWRTFG